ncbi:MAG: hypothetical protein PWQ68_623 [Thermoanaerobacteraceae bacterium]|nr:hypothetical protein [Thermoanaerobacteraceae bacterium]
MLKIAIIDDQEIVRQGLKMVLSAEKDMEVVGEGESGWDALRLCEEHFLDVILMDIKMPDMDGVEATKRIKSSFPGIKIIILTTFDDDEFIFEALKYGASGYLLKDAPPTKIIDAIREAQKGGVHIQPWVAAKVVQRLNTFFPEKPEFPPEAQDLTRRELEIIRLIVEGKNNREIADKLFITEGTVKNHLTKILIKLNLRDRTQLAVFALKNKLV